MQDVIALPECILRAGRLLQAWDGSGPDEHVDHMLPVLVNERRDDMPKQVIKSPADQGKAATRQIDNRWRKLQLPGKPGLHDVLIRGPNVREVVHKERSDVPGHEFVGEVGAP